MIPYIATFTSLLFFFMLNNIFSFSKNVKLAVSTFLFVYFAIFVGLRHEVGGDWNAYLERFEHLNNFSIEELFSWNPGYQSIQYISKYLGLGIYGVNTLCAIIFLYGFNKFIQTFHLNKAFSYLLAFPYIIMIVVSGYSRQGVAIGLIFGFISVLNEKKILLSFLYLILAISFHETALIGTVMYADLIRHNKKLFFVFFLTLFYTVYLIFEARFSVFLNYYFKQQISSSGAYIRILLNVFAGFFLLAYAKKWIKKFTDFNFWVIFVYISLFFLFFSILTNATTAADRMLLYFYPLQIVVFSRIVFLPSSKHLKIISFMFVVFLYFAVMMVWLLFAEHKDYWLPYGNLFFEVWSK